MAILNPTSLIFMNDVILIYKQNKLITQMVNIPEAINISEHLI